MALLTSIPCIAKQMNGSERASLALEAIKESKPVVALSKALNVSRQFIHRQKTKAVETINKAFSDSIDTPDDDKVLFNIPVTKSWLKQVALSLLLDCQSSFRGVKKMFANVLDYSISVSALFSYYLEAVAPA